MPPGVVRIKQAREQRITGTIEIVVMATGPLVVASEEGARWMWFGSILFGAMGIVFLFVVHGVCISADEAGVTLRGLFRGQFVPWSDVAGVELTDEEHARLVLRRHDGELVTTGLTDPDWGPEGHARRAADLIESARPT